MRRERAIRWGATLRAAFATLAVALVIGARGVAGAADAARSAHGGDEQRLIGYLTIGEAADPLDLYDAMMEITQDKGWTWRELKNRFAYTIT